MKSALGMADEGTSVVKTMEDILSAETTHGAEPPKLDAEGMPAVLPGIMDYEEGNNTRKGLWA